MKLGALLLTGMGVLLAAIGLVQMMRANSARREQRRREWWRPR